MTNVSKVYLEFRLESPLELPDVLLRDESTWRLEPESVLK